MQISTIKNIKQKNLIDGEIMAYKMNNPKKQDIATYFELPEGRMVMHEIKTKEDLLKEAREIIDNAEANYGAKKLKDLNETDKIRFKEIMEQLGQRVEY